MTMPHLMNCLHSEDGWCLDCVKELWEEKQRETTRTPKDLQQQAQKCQTVNGAAILCGIAAWLDGLRVIEGDLEPWEFTDMLCGGEVDSEEP